MTKAEILDLLKDIILEVLPELSAADIGPERSLVDLGANSVDRMEVITMAMERLDITIPMLDFADARNIGGIADVLVAKTP